MASAPTSPPERPDRSSADNLQGSCLCGAVRYEFRAPVDSICHCHCTMCQKAHGSPFGTYAPVSTSDFRFTQGSPAIRGYQSSPSARRLFCSICGSALLWDNAEEFPDSVFLAVATLDSPIPPPSQRHIHVSSKASWYEIAGRWPQSEFY
jgi:hypothetical protein